MEFSDIDNTTKSDPTPRVITLGSPPLADPPLLLSTLNTLSTSSTPQAQVAAPQPPPSAHQAAPTSSSSSGSVFIPPASPQQQRPLYPYVPETNKVAHTFNRDYYAEEINAKVTSERHGRDAREDEIVKHYINELCHPPGWEASRDIRPCDYECHPIGNGVYSICVVGYGLNPSGEWLEGVFKNKVQVCGWSPGMFVYPKTRLADGTEPVGFGIQAKINTKQAPKRAKISISDDRGRTLDESDGSDDDELYHRSKRHHLRPPSSSSSSSSGQSLFSSIVSSILPGFFTSRNTKLKALH